MTITTTWPPPPPQLQPQPPPRAPHAYTRGHRYDIHHEGAPSRRGVKRAHARGENGGTAEGSAQGPAWIVVMQLKVVESR